MLKNVIILSLLFLTACSQKEEPPSDPVTQLDLDMAANICRDDGGLKQLARTYNRNVWNKDISNWLQTKYHFIICNNDREFNVFTPNAVLQEFANSESK